jgi:hypothetical protein
VWVDVWGCGLRIDVGWRASCMLCSGQPAACVHDTPQAGGQTVAAEMVRDGRSQWASLHATCQPCNERLLQHCPHLRLFTTASAASATRSWASSGNIATAPSTSRSLLEASLSCRRRAAPAGSRRSIGGAVAKGASIASCEVRVARLPQRAASTKSLSSAQVRSLMLAT